MCTFLSNDERVKKKCMCVSSKFEKITWDDRMMRGVKRMCVSVSSKVRSVRIRAKLTKITWDDDLMLSFENTGTINSAYFFVLLVWYWYVQNKCRFLSSIDD